MLNAARAELAAGNAARDRRDWEQAAMYYRAYLERRPRRFDIWVQFGHALKESGQFAAALAAYSEAMRLNPDDGDLLINLAGLHRLMGHHDQATAFYERGADRSSNLGSLVRRAGRRRWIAQGNAARARGDWIGAADAYQAHVSARPRDFAIWVQLGHALKETGRRTAALEAYQAAFRLRSDDADLLLNLGHLYKVMGRTDRAISYFQQSAHRDPTPGVLHELDLLGVGVAEFAGGPPAPLRPSPAPSWRASSKLGRFSKARRALRHGDKARDRKDWPAAAQAYRLYLTARPDSFPIWVQLGHALKEAGRPGEALAAYAEAVNLNPDDADLLLNLGHLHRAMGDAVTAAEYYQRSADIDGAAGAAEQLRQCYAALEPVYSLDDDVISKQQIASDLAALYEICADTPSLLVIVPLFRAPELIPELFGSLIAIASELREQKAALIVINDSPDDSGLAAALEAHFARLAGELAAVLIENSENLGFIGSVNRGLRMAINLSADVLLLNSDALISPGSLTEIVYVSKSDPLISVVSPRSNNATICNFPYQDQYRSLDRDASARIHAEMLRYLPKTTYVPTAVGFCLYIRGAVLSEFGVFDHVYGAGYNEENDFIFRCNRRGYRAVLANHAFAHHLGGVSFAQSDRPIEQRELKNQAILVARYPEYHRSVQKYFDGIEYRAQYLLSGFLKDAAGRPRVLFDCRNVGDYYNGTFEHTRRLIGAFVKKYRHTYDCYISCSYNSLRFHGFDLFEGLSHHEVNESNMAPFFAVFRCAQPFDAADLVESADLAVLNGFLMLDTIAMDCLHLDTQGLDHLWRTMLETVDLLGFNSDFTRDQFLRRFDVPDSVVQFTSLCSTEVTEYSPGERSEAAGSGDHILLVGNAYAHKGVREALAVLNDHPERPNVVCLGMALPDDAKTRSIEAGSVPQSEVNDLYRRASVVLFPSYYEGFGLPIMHALAHRKPVVARRLPVFQEIQRRTPAGANIILGESTRDLVKAALDQPVWQTEEDLSLTAQTWESAADSLAAALRVAEGRFSYQSLLRKLQRVQMFRSARESQRRS